MLSDHGRQRPARARVAGAGLANEARPPPSQHRINAASNARSGAPRQPRRRDRRRRGVGPIWRLSMAAGARVEADWDESPGRGQGSIPEISIQTYFNQSLFTYGTIINVQLVQIQKLPVGWKPETWTTSFPA